MKIVQQMKVPYITDHGLGHGEAKRCAINHLQEGIIVLMDADGSHQRRLTDHPGEDFFPAWSPAK